MPLSSVRTLILVVKFFSPHKARTTGYMADAESATLNRLKPEIAYFASIFLPRQKLMAAASPHASLPWATTESCILVRSYSLVSGEYGGLGVY